MHSEKYAHSSLQHIYQENKPILWKAAVWPDICQNFDQIQFFW